MLSDAVIPTRAGPNEAGFDLTLVRYVEQVGVNAHMFDTGIAVTPPAGYYSLVVPHSSIVKHNVYVTNSVGVIDPTYTGSIKVVLSSTYHWAVNLWAPSVSACCFYPCCRRTLEHWKYKS